MSDLIYPSGNVLGIPDLLPEMCADAVPLPVWAWGSVARDSEHGGTWHCYVEDARFASLLRDPGQLVATGAAAAVEPNVSVYDDTPAALAIASLYRKRWVARSWQAAGVRVFVDMNLPEWLFDRDEWKLGLPAGWSAFATRGYERRVEALDREYAAALTVTPSPLFLVVGGGKSVASWCRSHPGCVHAGYQGTKRVYSAARCADEQGGGQGRRCGDG